ncbi:unnamed protein product [Lepeophtheirus salmonis]|uniref:(salmon louse) hypothetical protein n=1 Tax=Lepeophtheirus salmonis TaxID=72036 RepID=A0A7R8CFY9_LEPSM|nr:unnamed protein product [Lepeophtheirus salmonis]CAF2805615.1 unnamed protein product [Lepeophtheirus salmonis]
MSDHTYCKRRVGPKQREIHRLRRMIRAKDELIRELRKKLKIYGINYTPSDTQNTIINFRSTKSKMLQVHDFMTSVQKLSMESIKIVIKRFVLKFFPDVIKFSNVEALKLQHLLSINNAQFQKLRNFVTLQDKMDQLLVSCTRYNSKKGKYQGTRVNMMEFPSQWGESVIYVALFGDQKKAMAGPSYEDTYNETFCIVNSVLKTPVSPAHLHIFAVYEDTDKSSHLTKTFGSLHAQISSLQNSVYKNTNAVYTIKFIYMSDPARVISALGYQPASTSYPPSVELKSPSDIPVSFDLENIYENSSVFNDAAAETSSKEGGNSKKRSSSDVFTSIEEVGKSLHSHFSRYFSNFSRIRNRGLRLKWALQNYYLSKM